MLQRSGLSPYVRIIVDSRVMFNTVSRILSICARSVWTYDDHRLPEAGWKRAKSTGLKAKNTVRRARIQSDLIASIVDSDNRFEHDAVSNRFVELNALCDSW